MTRREDVSRHQFEIGTAFKTFDMLVRYKGTHLMAKEIELLHKLAFEAAAKSHTSTGLMDAQENFQNKLEDLRWVNGFNDVSDEDFNEIYTEWIHVVLELIDEWMGLDIFDYDREVETLTVDIGRVTDVFVNVVVIIQQRDPGG